ncbi:MAG: glycoside hydrolase family 38 C-terminal domain-containing protein [Clostridia bacterium]
MTQIIRLDAGSRRLEFETDIDWKELHRLLVGFCESMRKRYQREQFGYVGIRHVVPDYDKDRFEVCNHRYSALRLCAWCSGTERK